ncbi:hypothetical protein RJ924_33630, partial [Pseudomonas aeruginosa]
MMNPVLWLQMTNMISYQGLVRTFLNKNDLKAFIAFPSSLYPDDPNWIPPLFIERNEHLSAKNP